MTTPSRSFALGAYNESSRSVPVVASTRNPVSGWEPGKTAGDPGHARLESLESWDLTRFSKNPVILWQHESWTGPIGLGKNVRETPRGLEMDIEFAPASVEPRAEEAAKRVKAGLLRGVSVGFAFGARTDEKRDGKDVAVFRGNVLQELSLVTIPADENALVDQPAPDGVLGKRSDARDGGSVLRFDYGTLGEARRTPVGGIRAPARLTRTGVLEYRTPDGKTRRELRLPEEVFHADSLASLRDVPVTDLAHHRGFIDPSNFKEASLGHATDIRVDGKYVVGELHINDARAVVDVEAKRLSDVSCGYQCKLDATPGTFEGEPYDCIQRRIRYNHVAVLPPGRGRAGTDVGIRLDASDAECVTDNPITERHHMSDQAAKKYIRLDGKDFEIGSDEHVRHLDAKCEAQRAEAEKAKTELVELRARFDAGERAAKAAKDQASAEAAKAEKEAGARMKRRLRLMRAAMAVARDIGAEDDEDGDEEKMDALDEMSDRDLMIHVIKLHAGHEKFDGKDESDDYVRATFDFVTKTAKRADGVDSVVKELERAKRTDANEGAKDPEKAARDAMVKSAVDAGRKPLSGAAAK